jgi:hypothetical protein
MGLFFTSTAFLIAIVIIAMAVLLELEKEGWATSVFSIGIALILWHFKGDTWDFIKSNPASTIGFASTYVIVGVVWSFFKWRSYVVNAFDNFKTIKKEFIAKTGEITAGNKNQFKDSLKTSEIRGRDGGRISIYESTSIESIIEEITPLASKKKSVITSWIAYWPVSLIATLLNDPFRKFFEWVYDRVSGFYERITSHYKKEILK